ncbi:MAG: Gfo/Idh/MocA family oxidoreductase [Thermoguttaceae bacterium]|nr:Gfo/Idh/MocA family oxidoreductase [Thermoguttaceae bacterium]MBQ9799504.1 Gfo/Idh/MocA family oxidoreductase [Thermoguttaceae bacterium]
MSHEKRTILRVGLGGYGMMGGLYAAVVDNVNRYFRDAPFRAVKANAFVFSDEEAERAAEDGWTPVRSIDEMLENADYAYPPLPNAMHCSVALAAFEKGVHCFSEKPLAATLDEAFAMTQAAEANKRFLNSVNFIYRRSPATVYARKLAQSGVFGDMTACRLQYWQSWSASIFEVPLTWRFVEEQAGGASYDLASHCFDMLNYVTNERPRTVSAIATTHVKERRDLKTGEMRPVYVDDTLEANFALSGDAVGSLSVSRNCFGHENSHKFEICFERGTLAWCYDDLSTLWVYAADGGLKLPNGEAISRGWTKIDCNRKGFWNHDFADGHRIGYRDLAVYQLCENMRAIDALESGREYQSDAPIATFRDALEVQRCVAAALLSAKEGRRINVADVKATGEK